MRIYLATLLLLAALTGSAEVCYFSADRAAVPAGEIRALEVRAAHSDARAGSARVSGWTVSWPGADVCLRFDFTSYLDGVSESAATVQCRGERRRITKGLNLSGGFNTLEIEWSDDSTATISAGEFGLREVMTLAGIPRPTDTVSISAIGAPELTIQDFIIETNPNAFARLHTGLLPEELAEARQWSYIDRENDPLTAIVGGEYQLALVGNDLIYIGGARINADKWQTGMLKGSLTPTGFKGYYKLTWFDATGRRLPGENFAETDSAQGTMRLTFPDLGASIRFAAVHD